jgi:spore germination protein YaaH/nitrogen fixation protein
VTTIDNLNHRKRKPRSSLKRFMVSFLIILIFSCGFFTYFFWDQFVQNKERVVAEFNEINKPVFYQGDFYPISAVGEKESLKLPLALIQDWIDPSIIYEKSSDSVIITTEHKVLRFKTSQLDAFMNEKPYKLHVPVEKQGDIFYVPVKPLQELFAVDIRESDQGGVILVKQGDSLKWGKHMNDKVAPLRTGPSIRDPIVTELQPDEEVMIWSEQDEWFEVQRANGYSGYISKSRIAIERTEVVPVGQSEEAYVPWKPLEGKLNLTWEHVISRNPDTTKLPALTGLNVVSPTWFSLADGEGNIKNIADLSYVKWAQSRNYQIWAIFSNGFDPDRTAKALSSYDTRMKIIKQLLSFAKMYQLQGINIDFENVYLKEKENLVQFVKEMTPLMHEQGLVVSLDVTPKSTNEMWSMFYDRPALVKVLDYMMVMTYDEHWATSPKSGSVASLPWVESSLTRLLKEDQIPPSKLVLGVPFYTRVWTEETKDGKTKVSSEAYSMAGVQKLISDKKLTPVFLPEVGQNYVEYTEGNKRIRIWIEDEVSMKSRIELVNKYDLAGVASWRRGFERQEIWQVIQDTLGK